MFRQKFQILSLYTFSLLFSQVSGLAQLSDEFCKDLKDFGEFYENPDSAGLQQAELSSLISTRLVISMARTRLGRHSTIRSKNSEGSGWD